MYYIYGISGSSLLVESTDYDIIWFKFNLVQITDGPHQSCGDVLTDVCDGSCYKEHQLFSNHPTALQIIAYYDDISISVGLQ